MRGPSCTEDTTPTRCTTSKQPLLALRSARRRWQALPAAHPASAPGARRPIVGTGEVLPLDRRDVAEEGQQVPAQRVGRALAALDRDRHLGHAIALLPGQVEDLDVEGEAGDRRLAEQRGRGGAAKAFEAALRVAVDRQEERPPRDLDQ